MITDLWWCGQRVRSSSFDIPSPSCRGAFKLSDSRAALYAFSSSEAAVSVDILNIHQALNDLIETHKNVALQGVPPDCRLQGNKIVDSLANYTRAFDDGRRNFEPWSRSSMFSMGGQSGHESS
ncbi:hypothetical protein TNCV_2467641 [Trichonephila clavipes]|nr:hypothetical protein TNCV_2467641 [Trichonephila clavipes]